MYFSHHNARLTVIRISSNHYNLIKGICHQLTRNGKTWKETIVEGIPISPNNPIEAATDRMTSITPNILKLNFFSEM